MITVGAESLFGRMSALADLTRSRTLLVAERHELSVAELCAVLQLPQSTVSRHLKTLVDEGWLVGRADGTARFYRMPNASELPAEARKLWRVVREQVAAAPEAAHDAQRAQSVLARRRSRSQQFFSAAAGDWDRLRATLFGEGLHWGALLALLDPEWSVGDFGCGTGQVSAALAPYVKRVLAVDESTAMLAAARRRLDGAANVELLSGALDALPADDGSLDAAVLFLVLHHVADPAPALVEVARTLRPGGRLLVVDMVPHAREDLRREMGHEWSGFSAEQLGSWTGDAGFGALRYHALPPDPAAKGPPLFAATATKSG
jgi:ArsR family transcriptional regulator